MQFNYYASHVKTWLQAATSDTYIVKCDIDSKIKSRISITSTRFSNRED